METAKVAKSIAGDKPYQKRARAALPLLVRQANARAPIRYGELAEELQIPNPRTLNYVLGSVGRALQALSRQWCEVIPPLQCLVVNKNTGMPGEGIAGFMPTRKDYRSLTRTDQRRLLNIALENVFAYRGWSRVLRALGLQPVRSKGRDAVDEAAGVRGGGESRDHRRLKEFVARHPEIVGVSDGVVGETEFPLPSGDSLDVLFRTRRDWVAVEVKSKRSVEADIARGMFQCVKYVAVMEAYKAYRQEPRCARAVLVLEKSVPKGLVALRNVLGVETRERVRVT